MLVHEGKQTAFAVSWKVFSVYCSTVSHLSFRCQSSIVHRPLMYIQLNLGAAASISFQLELKPSVCSSLSRSCFCYRRHCSALVWQCDHHFSTFVEATCILFVSSTSARAAGQFTS